MLEVHLVMADDGVCHCPAVAEMGEFHLAQQGNPVFRQCAPVDDPRMLEHLLQETDTAYGLALGSPRCAVFEILAQVSLGTGFGQLVPDPWIFHVDEIVEFGGNLVVSFL